MIENVQIKRPVFSRGPKLHWVAACAGRIIGPRVHGGLWGRECIGFHESGTCLFCRTEDLLHSKTITGLATPSDGFVYFFIFQLPNAGARATRRDRRNKLLSIIQEQQVHHHHRHRHRRG